MTTFRPSFSYAVTLDHIADLTTDAALLEALSDRNEGRTWWRNVHKLAVQSDLPANAVAWLADRAEMERNKDAEDALEVSRDIRAV